MLNLSCTEYEYARQEIAKAGNKRGPSGSLLFSFSYYKFSNYAADFDILNSNHNTMMFIKITYTDESGNKKISGISLPDSVDFKQIAELHIIISRLSPQHAVDFTWQFDKSLAPSFIKGKRA